VVFLWGLLQGCLIPGLADVFFLPLALARPTRAYRLAALATAGTIVGSVALFVAGARALTLLQGPIAGWLDMSPAHFEETRATLARYGAWAIFASTMSPLSTKLTSIVSGAIGVPWPQFTLALLAGRTVRTFALAWVVTHGGASRLQRWIASHGGPPK
jgi:membrane protein YqaA with SNARE-associated domain